MKIQSDINKIFGRRKGKKLSILQIENLRKYIDNFSIFQKRIDGTFKLKKINPRELFDNLDDIRLEIGFGMGDFLFEKASSYPKVGFVGCEIFENGVSSLLSKILKYKIKNIRIHFGNCIDLVQNLEFQTLNNIYILYPDPWPKTKHKKRRLFNHTNATDLCSLLKKKGTLNIATDVEDYAEQVSKIMQKMENFNKLNSKILISKSKHIKEFNTKYEKKAYNCGRKTNYLIFEKNYV